MNSDYQRGERTRERSGSAHLRRNLANARLIAAAPELLAELMAARGIIREAFDYSDAMCKHGRGHSFTDIYGRTEASIMAGLDAAIAKARGKRSIPETARLDDAAD